MSDEQAVQLWVRTEKAQVYGPLNPTSVELLLDNGIIVGRVQVSLDGLNYVFPGRVPGVRMIFPRELWGDTVPEGAELDQQWSTVMLPPALPGQATSSAATQSAAVSAAPGLLAGPGARAAATQQSRPLNPVSNPSRSAAPAVRAPVAPIAPVPMTSESLFDDVGPPHSAPLVSSPSSVGVVGAPMGSSPSSVSRPSGVMPGAPPMVSRPSGVMPASPMVSGPSSVGARPAGVPGAPPMVSSASSVGARPVGVPGAPPMVSSASSVGARPVGVPGAPPMVSSASSVGARPVGVPGAPPMVSPSSVSIPAGGPRAASASGVMAAGSSGIHAPQAVAMAPPGAPMGPPVLMPDGPGAPKELPNTPLTTSSGVVITLPPTGDLSREPVMRLYALCASSSATALLSLRLSDRSLSIHFKRGAPEFVDSSHPEDSMQAFLLTQGLASPQQIEAADAEKARFGGELLPALFGMGLINPSSAFQQLSERAATIVFRAFMATRGTFSIDRVELPAARSMPFGNKWAVYLEQLRRAPVAFIQAQMSSAMDLPVMRAEGLAQLGELKLLPQELRALTLFDGTRTLRQLALDLPAEGETALRVAWMLQAIELVSFAAVTQPVTRPASVPAAPQAAPVVSPAAPAIAPPPAAVPGPPPAIRAPLSGPPPGASAPRTTVPYPGSKPTTGPVAIPPPVMKPPAQPAPAPVPRPVITAQPGMAPPVMAPPVMAPPVMAPPVARPATAAPATARPQAAVVAPPPASAADLKELQALLEKMKKQNYFEVLGLTKTADSSAVKTAYLKLAKNFHPDTVAPGSPEAVAKAKADIFGLIGEANRTLSDPGARADYVAEVEAGTAGVKVDVSQLLLAEELFQKGCILVKARKFAEAVKVLDDAIKANEREGEYYGWRGWAKYFTLQQDKSKATIEAMKDINHSIKMNPNAAAVHYFLGFLHKAAGDLVKAKNAFKRCVELDPRHIDAQRELRGMK